MKTRKPKFIVKYGRGGEEKCYSKKDLGDFLSYLAHGSNGGVASVSIHVVNTPGYPST